MKYIRPTHWVDIEKQDGLLFFAQILNETLLIIHFQHTSLRL